MARKKSAKPTSKPKKKPRAQPNPARLVDTPVQQVQAAALAKRVQKAAPKPAEPVLPTGVYFVARSQTVDGGRTAIAYAVGKRSVAVVRMWEGTIQHETMAIDAFTRLYNGRWPNYPIRRAAKLYLASDLMKTETALRALKMLVVS